MSQWGRPGFADSTQYKIGLPAALQEMKLETRVKIYALAVKSKFRRGTWNGCVLNQVGGVSSVHDAAQYFGESEHNIIKFIHAWDETSGHIKSDEQATKILINALLDAGLVEPTEKVTVVYSKDKVYRARIYTSEETRQVEELRAEIEAGAFDDLLAEMDSLALV